MDKYLLKLFITGRTARSEHAIENLKKICEKELKGKYNLQVIDVLEMPNLAEDDKVMATPTLIKQLPPPIQRLVGDLVDREKVLKYLDIKKRNE
jgi:circadian clock protein KaiB